MTKIKMGNTYVYAGTGEKAIILTIENTPANMRVISVPENGGAPRTHDEYGANPVSSDYDLVETKPLVKTNWVFTSSGSTSLFALLQNAKSHAEKFDGKIVTVTYDPNTDTAKAEVVW